MHAVAICFMLVVAILPSVCSARAIVGSGPGTDPLHETVYADIDGDGLPDLQAFAGEGGAGYLIAIGRVGPAQDSTLQLTGPLTSGAVVNESLEFSASGGLTEDAEIHPMNPSLDRPGGSSDGDYGFRITSGGATHYGWVHLYAFAGFEYTPLGTFSTTGAGASQWAYESDPNTPIAVGTLPEPAIAALLLLAASLRVWRRRH